MYYYVMLNNLLFYVLDFLCIYLHVRNKFHFGLNQSRMHEVAQISTIMKENLVKAVHGYSEEKNSLQPSWSSLMIKKGSYYNIFSYCNVILPTRMPLQKFLWRHVWFVTQLGVCHPSFLTSWCQASRNKHSSEESTFKLCSNDAKFQVAKVLPVPTSSHHPDCKSVQTQNQNKFCRTLCQKRQVSGDLQIHKVLPKCIKWMFRHCCNSLKSLYLNIFIHQVIITNTLNLKECKYWQEKKNGREIKEVSFLSTIIFLLFVSSSNMQSWL